VKIRDLNNESHSWKLQGYVTKANDRRPRSKLHLAARDLLIGLFPTVQILEEVAVPIFNPLFHTSAQDFAHQKKRDARKREWCEYNNITCVELPFDEKVEEWKSRVLQRNN